MTTGLHALHVMVGVMYLGVTTYFLYSDRFTTESHLSLEFAIFYWHLVDLVWLFVFVLYYWWGWNDL